MEPFVVSINTTGQASYRSFWSGPVGTAVLIVPGIVIVILGIVLWIAGPGRPMTGLFAMIVIFSGLYASYAGWDHRRRAQQTLSAAPLAFALDAEGATFPRGKHYPWAEVKFVLTAEDRPRILCTPLGAAYTVEELDHTTIEIDHALNHLSGGLTRLEQP